jgi:putative membrane-bound dehydrogenase-like protein
MRHRILICIIAPFFLTVWSSAQPPELPQKGAGPGKPLSPQEAQKLFKLDDGLRIELVACEPQIESPVAMTFDPDGRLWVVEMRDYPNGPEKGKPAQGRIRILEDKDGDGFFETATTWADNLLFANGLLLWKDGAIVTMAPHIAHLRDTQGAGKADKKDILYEGFAAQNPQLRVSHPILGLDGWIYCANGLRGGKAVRAGDKNAKPVDLSGMDFRFDPVTGEYEAITGQGQFGNTFDAWGNRFVCDNRHHLRHIVMENRYIKRNPYLAAPALVEDISVLEDGPLSSGGKVYPISKNWTTSSLHEGRFTAACGVFIYHGKLLGKAYDGAAFTCEPTGNLVHMEVLTPKGATFQAKPHKQGVEFLATTDDWFRPVFLTHGPEGAMYVVDMYRAVIEHPDFMPPELKTRPDLWQGKDKGRIWRIVPKNHKTKTMRPNLAKVSTAELVKTLEHDEPWWRTTAQRLLLEKNDKAMIEPLTKLWGATRNPHARILLAWLLERQKQLSAKNLEDMLQDFDAPVQEHALRIGESYLKTDRIYQAMTFRAHDRDARVQFQAALSLGGIEDWKPIRLIAYERCDDRWIRLAVQTALPKHAVMLVRPDPRTPPSPGRSAMVREASTLVGAQKDPDLYLDAYISLIEADRDTKWAGFAGLAEGLQRRGATLLSAEVPKGWVNHHKENIAILFSEASKEARDAKRPLDHRLLCVRILGHATWPTAKRALVPLLEETSVELRIAALRNLAGQQDKEVPALLMKLWPGAAPNMRREILEAMLRQTARVNVLLDEIESTRLKASELDPLRTRQLMNHKDAAIRERAKKLLANNVPADRQKALAKYQPALNLKGDAKNGRELFKKNCATCHRVAGVGIDVGPDIADTRTKTLGALLNDIIVPNAAIDANYVNYVVATKDGRILTGLLTAETASSITLKRAEGQTDVVLRKDIDEIVSTGISLMPDELEKHFTVQEMADLLSFLKNWRYLDGSVPIGP